MSSNNANNKAIAQVLAFLAALYPRFELTKATIQAYTEVLEDIPPDMLRAAAKDLGSRSTFFPAAAELRRAAFDLAERAQGLPSAYEAWQQIKSQVGGRALEMHPLALEAINALGGLASFRQSDISVEASWRARFIDAYDILAQRQRRERETLPQIAAYVDSLQLPAGNNDGHEARQAIAETAQSLMSNGRGAR